MRPYYQDDLVTIYHGDCREWMPEADVLVTDPPYGVALHPIRGRYERIAGDSQPFDPAHLIALGLPSVIFGANHFADRLPSSPAWLVWDKRVGMRSNLQSDCELAWTNIGATARLFPFRWNGGGSRHAERVREGTGRQSFHPTQKPVALMRWVIQQCPDGTVLDPYMGAGSTLIAGKSLGRRTLGVEIEERYCEEAANRCSQEVLGLTA